MRAMEQMVIKITRSHRHLQLRLGLMSFQRMMLESVSAASARETSSGSTEGADRHSPDSTEGADRHSPDSTEGDDRRSSGSTEGADTDCLAAI